MKQGANKTDQVKIKKMFADKKSAGQISKTLGIAEEAVKNFSPEAIEAAAKAKKEAK